MSPRVDQQHQLEQILRELAGSNEAARARVDSDARKLYFAFNRGEYIESVWPTHVDAADGKKILSVITRSAKRLENHFSELAPNLRPAFDDVDQLSEWATAIRMQAEAAKQKFLPRPRKGSRKFGARGVESWAARVWKSYTGKKASFTNHPYKDKDQAEGPYLEFLTRVFSVLSVTDIKPVTVVKARLARAKLRAK